MNLEKIKHAKTKVIGKQIEYYNEIPSTHTYAKQIAKDVNNNGKVILAEIQTQGIGTKGRKWYTGEGKNLAVTIILHPQGNVEKLDGLTVKIAEEIKKAIKELYGYTLDIKEPNDLLMNNKKICGILTEIHTIGEKIQYLIISFGFNVNEEKFSEETKEIATSLKRETGKNFEREEILIKIIEKLDKIIENL